MGPARYRGDLPVWKLTPSPASQEAAAGPDWRWWLLDEALAALGAVRLAARLGYSNHTLVSRISKGHIEASALFKARVIDRLYVVQNRISDLSFY